MHYAINDLMLRAITHPRQRIVLQYPIPDEAVRVKRQLHSALSKWRNSRDPDKRVFSRPLYVSRTGPTPLEVGVAHPRDFGVYGAPGTDEEGYYTQATLNDLIHNAAGT